jgi:hypothetical protein
MTTKVAGRMRSSRLVVICGARRMCSPQSEFVRSDASRARATVPPETGPPHSTPAVPFRDRSSPPLMQFDDVPIRIADEDRLRTRIEPHRAAA